MGVDSQSRTCARGERGREDLSQRAHGAVPHPARRDSLRHLLMRLWDMLGFRCSDEYSPLTLTLSPGAREQLASPWCLADGHCATSDTCVIAGRWTILPLPKGEGR